MIKSIISMSSSEREESGKEEEGDWDRSDALRVPGILTWVVGDEPEDEPCGR